MVKLIWRCLILLIPLTALVACTQTEPQSGPDEVTVQLKWLHQAQFAGFYLAHERGHYARENLKVHFLEGGPDVDITAPLASGKAQFSVVASELVMIKRRKMNMPITAIAAIYQRSAAVFVSQKASGITTPADFVGKTVAAGSATDATAEFEYQFRAMLKKQGLDPSKSQLVPYDPNYTGFLGGNVDVTAAYFTSGVIQLREKGEQINLIWPGDFGIHFYSDTLVTTEDMVAQNPALVERFLRASLKGWEEALGDGSAAVDASMRFAAIKDKTFQTQMLNALRPLVHTGEDPIGWMQSDVWQQMHQVLVENRIIDGPINDFQRVYTLKFLNAVYGKSN